MKIAEDLRHQPEFVSFLQNWKERYPDDEELTLYNQLVPEFYKKASAAAEIREVEGPIVRKLIKQVYDVYPFEQKHDLAVTKGVRGIRWLLIYTVAAMLVDDSNWLKDKFLYWAKTIVKSFRFPDKLPHKDYMLRNNPNAMSNIPKLKPHMRAIFEILHVLKQEFEKSLTSDAYLEIEPFLTFAIDVFTDDP